MTTAQSTYKSVKDRLIDARVSGRVVACCFPVGSRTDFVPIPEVAAGWWVGIHQFTNGELSPGRVIETDQPVKSTMTECWPDVELVNEANSLFREGEDDT